MTSKVKAPVAQACSAVNEVQTLLLKLQNDCGDAQSQNTKAIVEAMSKIIAIVPAVNAASRAVRNAMETATDIDSELGAADEATIKANLQLLQATKAKLNDAHAEFTAAVAKMDGVKVSVLASADKTSTTLSAFLPKTPGQGPTGGSNPAQQGGNAQQGNPKK
jgi:hypothetical protein